MSFQFINEIIAIKKKEIKKRKNTGLFFRPFWERAPFSLKDYLNSQDFIIIAEIKKASPSKGVLKKNLNPIKLAKTYEKAGAKMISVITEEHFFKGSLEYLSAVRANTCLPILRKDFILDPLQIEEAKAFGADVVLLISTILSLEELKELLNYSKKLGISCLVEVHTEEELEQALSAGAEVIGINNRNLKTLEINTSQVFKLFPLIPNNIPVIGESGYNNSSEIKTLKEKGIKGVLIGTSLMLSKNPGEKLKELLKEV